MSFGGLVILKEGRIGLLKGKKPSYTIKWTRKRLKREVNEEWGRKITDNFREFNLFYLL